MDPNTSSIPDAPSAPTTDPVATAGATDQTMTETAAAGPTVAELQAQVATLQGQLAAANTATVPAAADVSEQAVGETPEAAAEPAHAIAPGSAGAAVKELAQLVEQLGETTYLSRGDNPEHVFYDDLLAAAKRILSRHVRATAIVEEVETRLRDVAMIGEVTGEVWQTLRTLAAKKTAEAAA